MKEFSKRLIYNRWYSTKTAENYNRSIEFLDDYLKKISFWNKSISEPENITINDINSFIRYERSRGKDTNTCNNYLAGIKIFLRRNTVLWKKVEDDRKIFLAKTRKKKVEALTEQESRILFNYFKWVKCKWLKQELIKTRNLVICDLLLYTWIRVSELANLKKNQIREEMQIIWKGWKRRVVYLFKDDLALVDLYLFLRKDKSPYLLVSHSSNCDWKKLSTVAIEEVIRKWAVNAGIEKKVFPHKLRHTFATNLLRSWAKLPYIQELLWHSSITTTQHYLSVLNNELKDTQLLLKRF